MASLALAAPASTRAAPVAWADVSQRFYIETLGCPKNQVDSEKLAGPALPEPVGPSAAANDGLPAPGNDPALDQINQTLNRAKDLI